MSTEVVNIKHKSFNKMWEYDDIFEKRLKTIKKRILSKVKDEHQKIGRNDPCPCGSGQKYKFCCGIQK